MAQTRLELGGHHLAFGEREPLSRAILQIEVEIRRLQQLRLRPSRPSDLVTIGLYDGPAPERAAALSRVSRPRGGSGRLSNHLCSSRDGCFMILS